MNPKSLVRFLALLLLEGVFFLFLYFSSPSELENAWLLGYSLTRWAGGIFLILILAALLLFTVQIRRNPASVHTLITRWRRAASPWGVVAGLAFAALFLVGAFLFTYLFLPVPLRPVLAWGGLVLIELAVFLAVDRRQDFQWKQVVTQAKRLAFWQRFGQQQKLTARLLAVIALVYFAAFIPANWSEGETLHSFMVKVNDENITYQPLVRMLTPGQTLNETMYYTFIYEDYHYGYPFYIASALVMLPVRLLLGPGFHEQIPVNLLLLRQLINIVPILIGAALLVWLRTRFEKPAFSAILFALIITPHAVIGHNVRFWHPDALLALAVVLTLFFLDRDRLRFGPNFYLAAVMCGLATGIKLYGVFFCLAIAGYLIAGILTRRIAFQKAVLAGVFFILVMSAVTVFSNPFLFLPSARDRFMAIMAEKSGELTDGYAHDPDQIYRTGISAWLPFLEGGFGSQGFLTFLLVSLLIGCFQGERQGLDRLILAWIIMMGGYLLFFVAVKVTHYWLPVMLPLFSAALNFPLYLSDLWRKGYGRWQWVTWTGMAVIAVVLIGNLYRMKDLFTW